MWGKTLAFIILFILAFAIITALIPDSFHTIEAQDTEALNAISAMDLIIYSATGSDNMTFGYSSLEDAPYAPQWNATTGTEGEFLEIWWGETSHWIEARHVYTTWTGYGLRDALTWYYTDGSVANPDSPTVLTDEELVAAWDSGTNSSGFTARCAHIGISIVFQPYGGYTDISEAYEEGELWYAITYEWNPDDTGFNILTLLAKLLTFQGVGVGVPGVLGSIIDRLVSALFYIAIAVVAYVIITSLIPFIPGVGDT